MGGWSISIWRSSWSHRHICLRVHGGGVEQAGFGVWDQYSQAFSLRGAPGIDVDAGPGEPDCALLSGAFPG